MNKIDHSVSQINLPVDKQILNIAVNLDRLSLWVYEGYEKRAILIDKILQQTERFLFELDKQKISEQFRPTLARVKKEFVLLKENLHNLDKLEWAEYALTWANILTHRAKLA